MRILLFAQEFPYPPNHGGRADCWNRIKALKKMNHEIFLVTWSETVKGNFPTESEILEVNKQVSSLKIFNIKRDWKRVIKLVYQPSLVSARYFTFAEENTLISEITLFAPQVIISDGLYCSRNGESIARKLKVKHLIRTHNIEHHYMLGQLKLSNDFRSRISIALSILHLKRFEFNMLKKAFCFFDISIDDLNFWEQKGLHNGKWLPPIYLKERVNCSENELNNYDVCFLGNLNTPNNINGLIWFINNVLPYFKNSNLKILFLGSNPSSEFMSYCIQKGVNVIANPENPEIYLRKSKVLINPVKFGSGVNIKAIDMLFEDKPVVSTSIGVKGLPNHVYSTFEISDLASEFAEKIMNCLNPDYTFDFEKRLSARGQFSFEIINKLTESI